MQIGDTFIWKPDTSPDEHLYIVMTDPSKNDGKFVVFNLTKSAHAPKSFILKIGDHPYISKDSDVNFGDGMITDVGRVTYEVVCRNARHYDTPMNPSIVEKIAQAVKNHPAVSGDVEKMILNAWNL